MMNQRTPSRRDASMVHSVNDRMTGTDGVQPRPESSLGRRNRYVRDQRVAVELIINQLRVFLVFRSPVRAPSTVDEAHTEILVRWN